jgi:hypothetical protein
MTPDPLRVVLVSRDRRFLRVTGFLFTRGGALVKACSDRADMTRTLEDSGADLIVVDSGDSLGEAADFVTELHERNPEILVIVVADGAVRPFQRLELTLWPKWQQLSTLLAMADEARRLHRVPAVHGP